MTKTILYARVSTADQDADIQRAQAEAAGFQIDEVVVDEGASGLTTLLAERQERRRLFDMLREGDTLLVRWVDRLGRNYQDVTDTIRQFMRKGVIIKTVINGLTFDGATKDPMQEAVRDALIAFMAATAQAQAEATKEAQRAGIDKAKSEERYLGRKPSFTRKQFEIVKLMLGQDHGATAISKATGLDGLKPLTRQTVLRIKEDPAKAEAILNRWGISN
ncbi:recombinase family protein [Aliiroseovarius crassostreae]|uniref:recombinase family protein n=1 Tax=Aliiroseovarius crassostreae TaxID=154981 RepID=UPI0021AFE947|nr:recombinase family protein [Aliiroseovarius crassostreae]UWQ03970.1 recombinase family protein [Aliiroseovarius crassostreae]